MTNTKTVKVDMTGETSSPKFEGGQSNYYAKDVESLATFYQENFGFVETYRHPKTSSAEHIELRLGGYLIGFSSLELGRSVYPLLPELGVPRGEIVLWAKDVDGAHNLLSKKGVTCIRPPYDYDVNEQLHLRVALYKDPEGNIFRMVCQR